jgi:hypothetical protein
MESALEKILTKSYKAEMLCFMRDHPESFAEAFKLAVSNNQPYAWRAAWLLHSCMHKNDSRIKGQIKKIIKALPSTHDGHQRELLHILLQMDLPDADEGPLFDTCVNIWEGIEKSPSVRVTAFRVIIKIAEHHPDLVNEINMLTQEHFIVSLSPGVRRSVAKLVSGILYAGSSVQ